MKLMDELMDRLRDIDRANDDYSRRERLLLSLLNKTAHFYEDTIGILSGIFKLSEYVRQGSPEDDFYSYLVNVLLDESRCENASVFTIQDGGLFLKAASGTHVGPANKIVRIEMGDAVAGKCAQNGEFVLVSDVGQCDFFSSWPETRVPIGSMLCVPIKEGGRTAGVLNLSHSQVDFFNVHDVRMFELLGLLVGQMLTLLGIYGIFRNGYLEMEASLSRKDADLKSVSECYRSVVDASDEMILLVEAGQVRFCNRALRELFDHVPETLEGIFADDAAAVLSQRAARLQENESAEFDLNLSIGSRVNLTGEVSLKRIIGEQVLIIIKDVTLKQRLEAQSMQTEKLASLGLLTSGIAHELNNKLTPILGFADLIDTSYLKPMDMERFKVLRGAAESTKTIIESLLTFSRNVPPSRISFDLGDLVERAIGLYRPTAVKRAIAIVHERSAEPVMVLADINCFEQVLVNLINNAIDAIGDVPGTIRIISSRADGLARLSVVDSGPGLALDVLPKVFDPFFTTKSSDHGTGLGLSICYGIVRDHGGSISIQNSAGGGAEVSISLPIDRQTVKQQEADACSALPNKLSEPAAYSIMLVEDEPDLRRLLQDALGDTYDLALFANGVDALNHISDRDWDLIISDLRMPGMDGMEFYSRAVDSRADLSERFLFATGDTYDTEVKAFFDAHQIDFISKPFRIRELQEKVCRRLTEAGGAR